jgi:hypothetical protein
VTDENFWIATSAVAPVIGLAAVVALADVASIMGDASRTLARVQAARATAQAARGEAQDAVQAAWDPVLDRVAEGEAQDARKWALIAWLSTLLNLAVQAALLAVSLWALAYHQDAIRPWLAMILAIGGIVLLAWSTLVAAQQRFTLKGSLFRRGRPS